MMGTYQKYPNVKLHPLNFDDTMTDDENDENDDPATSNDEDCQMISYHDSQKTIADTSTYMDFSSTSFTQAHAKIQRADVCMYSTPGPIRVNRKRKYIEPFTSNTLLSHMPNEILDRVFSFCNKRDLLAIGATCTRFYDITSTQTHWSKINLCGKKVLESSLHRMISRKTKSLNMMSTVVFIDPLLITRNFLQCCLTRLDLSWAKFPGSDLAVMKGILNRCTQLQYLGLECQTVDAEVLGMVAKNRDLMVLNLSSCQIIDAQSLSHIFKSCTKLTDLNLSWTYPNEATAAVIINEIPSTIEKFAVSGMNSNPAFGDAGLLKILSRLPNLSELDIGDNLIVTSTFLLELGKRKNFRKISACRCYAIEPITFTTLKHVRVMNIFGTINDSGYDFMRASCPKVSFNYNAFMTIGRSQDTNEPNMFFGDDISEPY